MKHSDLLRLARKCIENKQETYICDAVDHAVYHAPEPANKQREEIRILIDRLLDGRGTFESWLYAHHGVLLCDYDPHHVSKLRRTRLAWIDDLINYYEEQGK